MRTLTKLGIGILAVIVLLSCAWMYHTHIMYENTYTSEYRYEVTVRTDSVLHNATLYVPLPIFEAESKIGCEIVAENASIPAGWDCEIVETKHGKMLKIHAEGMIPSLHAPPVPLPEEEGGPDALSCPAQTHASEWVLARVQADREINTKTPAGNEPMLSPKYNLARSVYRMPHPEDRTPPACYEYESAFYANYTAPSDAEVSIHAELTGANAWLGLRMVWQRVHGPGRRDAHRSAGRMVRCVRESCCRRGQVPVRGEMRLPAPHPPDDRIGSGSRQSS